MHGIISLLTCGVWLWGWAIVAILGARQVMTITVDQTGAVHRRGPKPRWPWVLGVVASFVLVLSIGAATGSETGGDGSNPSAETSVGASESSAAVDASAKESPEPSAKESESQSEPKSEEPEPEEPKLSVSQEQAIDKAADYLEYTAFSRSGLIQQLEFEGFSKADATYAVDNIEVNWMEQAAAKAADYLDYTAFSRSGLIQQLEFEGFTPKQAAHGADAVGL
jgi:hypothetical protein